MVAVGVEKLSAGPERPEPVPERPERIGEIPDDVARQNGVERTVTNRKRRRISFNEVNGEAEGRSILSRLIEHPGRSIEADRLPARSGRGEREKPRSAPGVGNLRRGRKVEKAREALNPAVALAGIKFIDRAQAVAFGARVPVARDARGEGGGLSHGVLLDMNREMRNQE